MIPGVKAHVVLVLTPSNALAADTFVPVDVDTSTVPAGLQFVYLEFRWQAHKLKFSTNYSCGNKRSHVLYCTI